MSLTEGPWALSQSFSFLDSISLTTSSTISCYYHRTDGEQATMGPHPVCSLVTSHRLCRRGPEASGRRPLAHGFPDEPSTSFSSLGSYSPFSICPRATPSFWGLAAQELGFCARIHTQHMLPNAKDPVRTKTQTPTSLLHPSHYAVTKVCPFCDTSTRQARHPHPRGLPA